MSSSDSASVISSLLDPAIELQFAIRQHQMATEMLAHMMPIKAALERIQAQLQAECEALDVGVWYSNEKSPVVSASLAADRRVEEFEEQIGDVHHLMGEAQSIIYLLDRVLFYKMFPEKN